MVCSSTLIAMAVIHSAKRWKPWRVKAQAKALSKACQMDQVSLASVMMRLLYRGQLGLGPPGRFRPGDASFNTVRPLSYSGVFRGNYCLRSSLADHLSTVQGPGHEALPFPPRHPSADHLIHRSRLRCFEGVEQPRR